MFLEDFETGGATDVFCDWVGEADQIFYPYCAGRGFGEESLGVQGGMGRPLARRLRIFAWEFQESRFLAAEIQVWCAG